MKNRDKAILAASALILVLALMPACTIRTVLCLFCGMALGHSLARLENERKR